MNDKEQQATQYIAEQIRKQLVLGRDVITIKFLGKDIELEHDLALTILDKLERMIPN